jgi:hypothetical protein
MTWKSRETFYLEGNRETADLVLRPHQPLSRSFTKFFVPYSLHRHAPLLSLARPGPGSRRRCSAGRLDRASGQHPSQCNDGLSLPCVPLLPFNAPPRCSSETRKRSTSWTRPKATLPKSMATLRGVPYGPQSDFILLLVTDSPTGTSIPIRPSLWTLSQTPSVLPECISPMAHTSPLVGMALLALVETLAP